MRRKPPDILTPLIAACMVFFLSGCTSFPKPTEEKSALLIIPYFGSDNRDGTATSETFSETLTYEGPEKLVVRIAFQKMSLLTVPIKPGTYRLVSREVTHDWGRGNNTWRTLLSAVIFTAPANSIVLHPGAFRAYLSGRNRYMASYSALADGDRQRISDELSDTIGFSEWIGSLFIGFGQYPPRLSLRQDEYRLRLLSQPEGAEVIVDSEIQGVTPIAVDLKAGKHLVEVRKEGFATWRNYIDADSDNEISVELKTVTAETAEAAAEPARNQYGLVVVPFRNIGSPEFDYLQSVFDQSLEATFSQDKRIAVFKTPEDTKTADTRTEKLKPDFGAAVKTGADLMIAWDFYAREDNLLIHAALYDVQKENVKADILYTSKTGLSIFDSIDDMTREFGAAVDRVLPESGREIVQKQEVVKTEITTMEKKVSEKDIIERRARKRHDIGLSLGMGTILDSVEYSNGSELETRGRYKDGIAFGIGFAYTYHFTSWLGLNFMAAPMGNGFQTDDHAQDLPLYFGPEFTFSGLLTDFYFRILGQYRVTAAQNITYEDNSQVYKVDTGEFFYYGLTVDAGTKIYLYKRYSSAGWYANFGLRFSPYLQRSPKSDFSKDVTGVPLDMMLYTGLGVRL